MITSKLSKNTEKQRIQYPCIMQSTISGTVVIFESIHSGTILIKVEEKEYGEIGYHENEWSMDNFVPITGSITLTQEL